MSTRDLGYGPQLRRRRESFNLTLARLSELAGVSAPYLSQIETGKRQPSDEVIAQIEAAFANLTASPALAAPPPDLPVDAQMFQAPMAAGSPPAMPGATAVPVPGGRWPRRGSQPSSAAVGSDRGGGRYLEQLLQTRSPEVRELLLAVEAAGELARELTGRPLPPAAMADLVAVAARSAVRGAAPQEVESTLRMAAQMVRDGLGPESMVGLLVSEPGRPVSLGRRDVAVDAEGRAWMDPGAVARLRGHGDEEARAVLHSDGRLWVCLPADSAAAAAIPRDEDRHTMRVVRAVALPGEAVPFGEYEQTVLVIELPGGTVEVGPAEPGVASGRFPEEIGEVVVLTAENPDGELLTARENAQRMTWLRAMLAERGWRTVPALMHVPGDALPHAPQEEAIATLGVAVEAVVDVATAFGQRSVFQWTATARAVVTATRRRYEHGWRIG